MSTLNSFIAEISIEVTVVIDHFVQQPAMGPRADSDLDCWGYTECDWHLEDGKGNRLPQVEAQLTREEIDAITEWAIDHVESNAEFDDPEPDDYDSAEYTL